jgi:hypothetical protein
VVSGRRLQKTTHRVSALNFLLVGLIRNTLPYHNSTFFKSVFEAIYLLHRRQQGPNVKKKSKNEFIRPKSPLFYVLHVHISGKMIFKVTIPPGPLFKVQK